MSKQIVPWSMVWPPNRDELLAAFTEAMIEEYLKARKKFGPFDNGHEGLCVIWEEFEELKKFVFSKNQTAEQIANARLECIQIAAMAMSFSLELLEELPE